MDQPKPRPTGREACNTKDIVEGKKKEIKKTMKPSAKGFDYFFDQCEPMPFGD